MHGLRICSLFFLFISTVNASTRISAYREENRDYSFYTKRIERTLSIQKFRGTPLGLAKYYKEETVPQTIGWSSLAQAQARFRKIRDERFIKWKKRPDFLRRISWLYPTDGCWLRAVLFNRGAWRLMVPVPNTIYAFGNLSVKTANHPSGRVGWWFHLASVVSVEGQKYVMDPSLNPHGPILLKEWLGLMGEPGKIKIAICGSGTFSPGDNCQKETNGLELEAQSQIQYYLNREWENLKVLKRDPEQELGERPPW